MELIYSPITSKMLIAADRRDAAEWAGGFPEECPIAWVSPEEAVSMDWTHRRVFITERAANQPDAARAVEQAKQGLVSLGPRMVDPIKVKL